MTRLIAIVLAAACAVCCGGDRAPLNRPGQVVVIGDTSFRTRDERAIDVTVVRTFQGHQATGVATLHELTLDAAQRSSLVRVAAARAWLSFYGVLASEPSAAYEAMQRGIDELGTEYRSTTRRGRQLIDDTGQIIRLAQIRAQRGDMADAASELFKVLQSRVAMSLRVFKGSID